MITNSTKPSLADLQSKWDTDFAAIYRSHLWMAALAAMLYLPVCLWWVHSMAGWPLTLGLGLVQILSIPMLAQLPAQTVMPRRPTQQSYDENKQIRDAARSRVARVAASEDPAALD